MQYNNNSNSNSNNSNNNNNSSSCCIIRIIGRDIHRRKWYSTGYHIISSGFTSLSCSGIIYYNIYNQLCILCSADIIIPFLSQSCIKEDNDNDISNNINFADEETQISALLSSKLYDSEDDKNNNNNNYTEKWYNCSLVRVGCINSVDSVISNLLKKSNDFHLGN